MSAFHTLTLGLLGGKKKTDPVRAPNPTGQDARRPTKNAVYTGDKAIPRDQLAATQLGDTKPPDAQKDASTATATALMAAARTRRRAAAGNAGRATGGVQTPQLGTAATGSPRSLIGY